jgi:hypothetical protein
VLGILGDELPVQRIGRLQLTVLVGNNGRSQRLRQLGMTGAVRSGGIS